MLFGNLSKTPSDHHEDDDLTAGFSDIGAGHIELGKITIATISGVVVGNLLVLVSQSHFFAAEDNVVCKMAMSSKPKIGVLLAVAVNVPTNFAGGLLIAFISVFSFGNFLGVIADYLDHV